MTKWKLKSCPRCHGDIYVERNLTSWHEQCLQCGYVHYQPIDVTGAPSGGRQSETVRTDAAKETVAAARS